MKKKSIILIIIILIVICIGGISLIKYNDYKKVQTKLQQEKDILDNIKNHFSEFVVTNKETKLYKKDNDEFIEFGKINASISVSLDKTQKITLETKYFYIPDLDLYIYYEDVNKGDEYIKSDRYKKYIYFNNNIITKPETTFYNKEGMYLYQINNSFEFKVLVKEQNRYGVIFNDELLYVNKDDVEGIYKYDNGESNKNKIKTVTYHFIYNPETTPCSESICQSLEQFESHLKYLSENDCFTLKLDELEMYLDGKINIPEKSIVLTIDDGTILEKEAITLLEKYNLNATLFVITSWIDPNNFISSNLDLESHTHDMHNQYECPGYGNQGGGILCLPEEKVLNDLRTSQEKLGGSKYFAYPFFDFNARAISLLKEADFNMAFIGQYDTDGYSYPGITDKYKLRRKTIFSDTTLEEFKTYLN